MYITLQLNKLRKNKILFMKLNANQQAIMKKNKFLVFLLVIYIVSVFVGAYRFYSPLPDGDMWHGYINFYLNLLNGDTYAWWEQHNEHRIILSKLFFYLDLALFNGLSLSLIPLNLLLLVSSWGMLLLYANKCLKNSIDAQSFFYFLVLLTVFSFSWKQDENIIWAFQSQFWFVYLLPLLSFYFMGMSEIDRKNSLMYFLLSCCFGVLSIGTMANGILVLPLLTVLALLLKKRWEYIVVLSLLTIIFISLFFYDYHPAEHEHSILENIKNKKLAMLLFFVEYLGSPLKSLVGSFLLGILHLYLIFYVIKTVLSRPINPLHLTIIAFVIYYLISGMIVSAARVDIGIKAALVGRYTTPTIISLFLVLIVYFQLEPKKIRFLSKRNITIVAILMLGTQARTFVKNVEKIHDGQNFEAMQLELGIHPKEWMQKIADKAVDKNLSIFGTQPYIDKRKQLGKVLVIDKCEVVDTKNTEKGKIITKPGTIVYIVDSDRKIQGFGVESVEHKGTTQLVFSKIKSNSEFFVYQCD